MTFLVPAVPEATGVPQDVVVASSNGAGALPAAFTYTPTLSVDVSGSTALGGSLEVDWLTDPLPGQQSIWLWLDNPTFQYPPASVGGFAGLLHTDVMLLILMSFPENIHPLDLNFGPLDPGTTLYWRVTAFDAAGNSSIPVPASFTLAGNPAPPAKPVLSATAVSANAVRLDWTIASSHQILFRIEARPPGGDFAFAAEAAPGSARAADASIPRRSCSPAQFASATPFDISAPACWGSIRIASSKSRSAAR